MVAHIQYNCLDEQPVPYSRKAIDYIRGALGFQGILISDCLTMKALPGDPGQKAAKVMEAGLDVALYGGCRLERLYEMSSSLPQMPRITFEKIHKSLNELEKKPLPTRQTLLSDYQHLREHLQKQFDTLNPENFSDSLRLIVSTLEARKQEQADYTSPLYKA